MNIDLERLRKHVEQIAQKPHPAESEELARVRAYIKKALTDYGWNAEERPFSARFEENEVVTHPIDQIKNYSDKEVIRGINLVARHPMDSMNSGPRFCLGAHYDTKPETPGADDNTSAVAGLLEIAKNLSEEFDENPGNQQSCGIELVAFDLEECGMLGGLHHARQCLFNEIDLVGMVSLEMLGFCSQEPGSQSLPDEIKSMYPDVGNFIAIVGNQNSTDLIKRFHEGISKVENLPAEMLQVPNNGEALSATRLSDHSPFWDAGYAALMITDTSFMRNPHYHQPTDTPDTLDYKFLTQVTEGCYHAVRNIVFQ